ncbi:MAG: UbiA family prenyltransferase, partial [Rhodospirillales bacterium]|nr:UbiA family prenyltransferase [Rhodospirillales bacterium]
LPTVWSNTLAGAVLAGAGGMDLPRLAVPMLAFSLFYVGGMYLNDAFDQSIDARERPDRPIPAGLVSAGAVFATGFAMLGGGVALLASTGFRAGVAGMALATVIVGYDWHHKGNPLSPVVMALCRALVYAGAALAMSGNLTGPVLGGAAMLLCYVIGLTYTAKRESVNDFGAMWPLAALAAPFLHAPLALEMTGVSAGAYALLLGWVGYTLSFVLVPFRRNVKRAVGAFIAGISLLDALLIAGAGQAELAGLGVLSWGLTLWFQRHVPGT